MFRTFRAFFPAAALAVAAGTAVSGVQKKPAPEPWPGDRFEVLEKSIDELQGAMTKGTVTSRELVQMYLARIDAYDRKGPRINAIIAVNPRALDEADALDRERKARGPRGPLHGVPLVVKDNFDLEGLPTTAGTIAFATLYPADDAFQVKKLKEAGAVIIAKTNLQELASGIVTIGSMGGQTKNPYDLTRNPGGSSGGTGAAVAANFAAAGLGSDTCGSIRIPASHNNLVGLRPTMGLSSRDGIVPLSHSQDVGGPLARSVTDVALLLDATAGIDPADEITRLGAGKIPRSYRDSLKPDALKGARIGVLTSLFGTAAEDNEAGAVVRRAIDVMKKQGADVMDVAVPGLDDLLTGSSVIDAEFKADLAAYLSHVPNPPVKSLEEIINGGLLHVAVDGASRRRNSADPQSEPFRRARIKREAIRAALAAYFDEQRLDAVVYPTMRRKPAVIGETQAGTTCQVSAASGWPALSVPAGFTNDGLPIGVELLGPGFSEARLLALGYAYEQAAAIRQAPFSAPALAGGKPPQPQHLAAEIFVAGDPRKASMKVELRYDVTTATLQYQASTTALSADDILGAWIQRGAAGENGPAVYQVLMRGDLTASGAIVLPPADRDRLRDGRFYIAFYTRQHPKGERAPLGPLTIR